MMEERKIKPADFRLEDLDRGIIVREDELEYELFKLHLYEDEVQKAEAAAGSEMEGEMVEKWQEWVDGLKWEKYQITRFHASPKALLVRPRGYAIEERIKSAEERKREILRELQNPPSFGDSKVYRAPNGDYVIELQFERLGRNRRLEIKTSSLDADFIRSLPKELFTACRNIPHNEFVIPHILEHIKRLMENPVCRS